MNLKKRFSEKTDQSFPLLSFEFFPPKSAAASATLFKTIQQLKRLEPSFVSVTYGAGGSSRDLTHHLVVRISQELQLPTIAHLTCVGSSQAEIKRILDHYQQEGIHNIMALRGDLPKDRAFSFSNDVFPHAVDLVRFIKQSYPNICVGVAGFPEGHPDCANRLLEMEYLKAKVDAGADYVCTQLFFDNRDFYDFCERCDLAGINVPIIAGIMPITSEKSLRKMAELAKGSRFPAALLKALRRAQNAEEFENIGIHWVAQQVFDLLDQKVAGIHFYTLNKAEQVLKICKAIGIQTNSDSRACQYFSY